MNAEPLDIDLGPARERAGRWVEQRVVPCAAIGVVDAAGRFRCDFVPGTDGAIYGWPTHGMMGSFRRHGSRSRVQGLYLAGGSVHPGPGVPMTAISGRIAARSVLGDLGRDR